MIDSTHHIELDGVKYALALSEQGDHYDVGQESLRPPNAVTVQGESRQKFQSRLDTLMWSWTDWSGGEGQIKYDPQNPNRSYQLNAVRAFEEPGKLKPGWYFDDTGVDERLTPVKTGTLDGMHYHNAEYFNWSDFSEVFGSVNTLTGPTNGVGRKVAADGDYAYFVEKNSQNVYRWSGVGAATTISTGTITASALGYTEVVELGDYVYVMSEQDNRVWEVAKAGGSTVEIYNIGQDTDTATLVVLDGKVYLMETQLNATAVHAITPTSAAGAGFGKEIARFQGFAGSFMWAHTGKLFLAGSWVAGGRTQKAGVMYLAPVDLTYGTLGIIRDDPSNTIYPIAYSGVGTMLDHFFVTDKRGNGDNEHAVWQIDSVSGGIANISYDEDGHTDEAIGQIAEYQGDLFLGTLNGTDGSTARVCRVNSALFSKNSSAISGYHDFDFVGEKYLGTLELSCEPLPADWTVYVDYQIDNDGTWTNAITYSTTSGTGTSVKVTTDTSTVEFRVLALRIRMVWGGAGVPTSGPAILGVEARSAVVEKVGVFRLMVDLNDPFRGGSGARSGTNKAAAFRASCEKDTALDFKDGFISRLAGEYNQYDVTVDSWREVLDRPGEGYGMVTLREVV